jgi:hypothetical protein
MFVVVMQLAKEVGHEGTWSSYEKFIETKGKMVGDELIRLSIPESRPNKDLPIGHAIPFPFCMEFRLVVEKD